MKCSLKSYVEIIPLLSVLSTLADDEDATSVAAAVWFEPSSYTVYEDEGNVSVSIRANFPGGMPPGEVSFTTVDGSATGKKQTMWLIICHIFLFQLSWTT